MSLMGINVYLFIALVFAGFAVWLGVYAIIAKFCGADDLIERLLKVLIFSIMFAIGCASFVFLAWLASSLAGKSFSFGIFLLVVLGIILAIGLLVFLIITIIFGIRTIPSLLYLIFIGMPIALKNSGLNKFIACIIGFPLGIIAALPCLLIITVIGALSVSLAQILPLFLIAAACSGGVSVIIIVIV